MKRFKGSRHPLNRLVAATIVLVGSPVIAYPQGNSGQRTDSTDAWGAKRSFGLATAEVAAINGFVWGYNEFVRQGGFTSVSPRTWADNLSRGFAYDDNNFGNNNFGHPFHGNLYYNAARTNGLNYWESAPFAIMGSFFWECCGEQHQMAINDWINTGIGGIAIGEMLYRVTSTILDNRATGVERVVRETASLLLNPLRGLNRIASGRAARVYDNPADQHPSGGVSNKLDIGSRTVAEGSFGNDQQTHVFFENDLTLGNPLDSAVRRPFDYLSVVLQLNFGEEDKGRLGRLNIKGNLFSTDLKRSDNVVHRFSIVQDFDYWNNRAFEFGGQSFGARFSSGLRLSDDMYVELDAEPQVLLLGAVNSEYAFLAEVPEPERIREYDYGPGAGVRLSGDLRLKGATVVEASYWLEWIHTVNGSTGNHLVHIVDLRLGLPVAGPFALGADYLLFLRDSFFTGFTNVVQRVPQFRVYLRLDARRFDGG